MSTKLLNELPHTLERIRVRLNDRDPDGALLLVKATEAQLRSHTLVFSTDDERAWKLLVENGHRLKAERDAAGHIFPPFLDWEWDKDESYARLAVQNALTKTYGEDT